MFAVPHKHPCADRNGTEASSSRSHPSRSSPCLALLMPILNLRRWLLRVESSLRPSAIVAATLPARGSLRLIAAANLPRTFFLPATCHALFLPAVGNAPSCAFACPRAARVHCSSSASRPPSRAARGPGHVVRPCLDRLSCGTQRANIVHVATLKLVSCAAIVFWSVLLPCLRVSARLGFGLYIPPRLGVSRLSLAGTALRPSSSEVPRSCSRR